MDRSWENWHCCFCFESTTLTDDGLLLAVERPGKQPSQQLGAHATCLAERLHPQVVFDAEAFDD